MQGTVDQLMTINTRTRLRTLWLTVFFTLVSASVGNAAEVSITRNQLPMALGPYLDVFEDPSREMTIEDILSEEIPWHRSSEGIPTLGVSSSAFWLHLRITSRTAIDEDLILSVGAPTIDRLDFYFVSDNILIGQAVAGDTVPLSNTEYPYRFPVIPINLAPPGETNSVYIRAISTSGIEIPIELSTMASLAERQQGQLVFLGALFATFTIGLCFCAAYYYNLRDKEFLGYMTFFAFIIPLFLNQTGMGRVLFWGESVDLNNRIGYLSAIGLIASMSLLGQAVSLKARYRDLVNLVLRYVGYLMIPAALFFTLAPLPLITSQSVLLIMALGFAMAMSVTVLAGITATQGSRWASYLFGSWTLIILAFILLLTYRLTFLQRAETAGMISEGLMIVAAGLLLLSMFEYVRKKNEDLSQFRLESQAKGDFLRNVSREFLTPVHLILANSKRLIHSQSSCLDEPSRQHLDTVIKQSDHLHSLINDLLEMAEIESENFEPQFELVEMSHFLNEIRNMLLPSTMEKNLEFKTEYASANLLIQTDVARLQHALVNIITNAIKYTDQGIIRLGYKAVYFRRRLGVEIFVSDTGRGMSEEFQRRMFQEFAREDDASEKDPQGTGLDMVIVKRMIEKLGGEITFESTRGEGSSFYIRLPLRDSHN